MTKLLSVTLLVVLMVAGLVWLFTQPALTPQLNPVDSRQPSASSQDLVSSSTSTTTPQLQPDSGVSQVGGIAPERSKDMSGLDLDVGTNVIVLIEDSSGRRTGRDIETNRILQEIPQSGYFEGRLDNAITGKLGTEVNHEIEIGQPSQGFYRLTLSGLQQATYDLVVSAYSSDGTAQPTIEVKGNITSGSQVTFQLQYASAPGAVSTLTRLSP